MNAIEQARALLAETLGIAADDIADDASFDDIERWDSIAHLRLVLALEEKIGRQVTSEDTMSLFSLPEIAAFLTGQAKPA